MNTCQGCDTPLPPSKKHGRPRKWCSERCRKTTLYSRPCVDCGWPLNGSDGKGPNAPQRCNPCAAIIAGAERKVWTRDALIDAIVRWVETYDSLPTVSNWDPCVADRIGHPEMCARGRVDHIARQSGESEWPHPDYGCPACSDEVE